MGCALHASLSGERRLQARLDAMYPPFTDVDGRPCRELEGRGSKPGGSGMGTWNGSASLQGAPSPDVAPPVFQP